MSTYYRESFEYPPIRMFFDTNGADTIVNNGNIGFTLNQAYSTTNKCCRICKFTRTNNSQY